MASPVLPDITVATEQILTSTSHGWKLYQWARRYAPVEVPAALADAANWPSRLVNPDRGVSVHRFDTELLLAQAILGHDIDFPATHRHASGTGTARLHTGHEREAHARSAAHLVLLKKYGTEVLLERAERIGQQVLGQLPVHGGANGDTVLTGQAALDKRAELFNYWYKRLAASSGDVDGRSRQQNIVHWLVEWVNADRNFVDFEESQLATAKRAYLEEFQESVDFRCFELFGRKEPRSESQAKARYAMLRLLDRLEVDMEAATTVQDAFEADDPYVTALEAIQVDNSPVWEGDSEPLPPNNEFRYAKRGRWKAKLHAHVPGDDAAERASHGNVRVKERVGDWSQFELVFVENNAAGGAKCYIQRKSGKDGHPPAGRYVLTVEARNFEGKTDIEIAVVVS